MNLVPFLEQGVTPWGLFGAQKAIEKGFQKDPFADKGIVIDTFKKHFKNPLGKGAKKGPKNMPSRGLYGARRPGSRALMPYKRTSTKRKRTASYKAKKKTKRIKKVIKGVKKHYDDYGRIERRHCNWLGVQHHGSHARMLAVVGESLIRALLAKKGCYPATYSDSLSKWFPTATNLHVMFRRLEPNEGTDEEYQYIKYNIHGRTYQELVDQFVFDTGGFRDAILGDVTAAPQGDKVGYYPTEMYLQEGASSTSAGQRLINLVDVEASYVTFSSYCALKVQNKSLNDQGNANTDQVGQNPLEGKTYFFAGPAAKVRSDLQAANSLYDDFAGEHLDETDTGIIGGPSLTVGQATDAISHPVRPQSFFKNCRKTTDIKMVPGGSGTLKLSYKFKGTLQQFCSKANSAYGRPGLGHVTWIALEKKFRDAYEPDSPPDIIIGYNRDCNLYANTLLRTKKYMLRTHNDTNMGSI